VTHAIKQVPFGKLRAGFRLRFAPLRMTNLFGMGSMSTEPARARRRCYFESLYFENFQAPKEMGRPMMSMWTSRPWVKAARVMLPVLIGNADRGSTTSCITR
jgi:hypothetical protein